MSFPGDSVVKNQSTNAGYEGDVGSIPGSEIPWSRKWKPTPVFLPGKPCGQRIPLGCSPWGDKESDKTE